MFGIALALANSREGFLLIDEVENGLHYSVQSDFWKMVLQAARDNDVQVLATTHSWDVVEGFTKAATEMEELDAKAGATFCHYLRGARIGHRNP